MQAHFPPTPPLRPAHGSPAGAITPTAPVQTGQRASARSRRPIVFSKGRSRWVFICDPGDERALLEHVGRIAAARQDGFDWFDAALVGHQIRQRLNNSLSRSVDEPADPEATASGCGTL